LVNAPTEKIHDGAVQGKVATVDGYALTVEDQSET
jgi:hypothetical protein